MIFLPISTTVILTFLASKAFSEIIHCYECDDCKSSKESLLRACPQPLTTNAPDSLAPELVTTTTAPPTQLPALEITTTEIATTEHADATPAAPALESVTTLTPVLSTTSDDDAETNDDENTEEVRKRSVRSVSYRSLMIRRYAREIEVSHHCYSIKGYGGDQNQVKKGCVKVTGTEKACDVLKKQYNVSSESCVACKGNKCNNSGVRNFVSILYAVVGVLIAFF